MKSKIKRFIKEWVIPFGVEVVVIVLLIKFVFFFTYVPTGSMIPTIAEKSWLFAVHVYNVEETVERGDILVFDSEETETTLIKRVVGLPGETVEIISGVVYINGEKLEEEYVVHESYEDRVFQIPEGMYLFLGDNRAGSSDARGWRHPYVPAEDITGKAVFTIFPFKNFGILK
ncbi:MAG: signal peptidase I [Ruminococcaceae bacterium]|nr:signal peptidase I [Oscillospiraceae bacterium]